MLGARNFREKFLVGTASALSGDAGPCRLLKCGALRDKDPLLGGKYRFVRLLGAGTAGEVWEAENTFVMRRVAIKTLRSDLARDPEVRARFSAEARAAGRIRHPNVVDVFDLGLAESGEPFMVMELCDGETLDSVIERRGAVGVSYACELLCQVLNALNAAHSLGIVHRDLKPANVMVVHPHPEEPVVKVLDFGIAKGLERERAESEERGLVFGTPLYMAPEQAVGEVVDHRSDLFAVGVILFELLAGRPPFSGNTPEILLANVLSRPPLPLTRFAKSRSARARGGGEQGDEQGSRGPFSKRSRVRALPFGLHRAVSVLGPAHHRHQRRPAAADRARYAGAESSSGARVRSTRSGPERKFPALEW